MPSLCDAACQKIIINTRLVAIIAAAIHGREHSNAAAADLAAAANYFNSVVDVLKETGVIVNSGSLDWQRCEEAKRLHSMLANKERTDAADVQWMREEADRLSKATGVLLAGGSL